MLDRAVTRPSEKMEGVRTKKPRFGGRAAGRAVSAWTVAEIATSLYAQGRCEARDGPRGGEAAGRGPAELEKRARDLVREVERRLQREAMDSQVGESLRAAAAMSMIGAGAAGLLLRCRKNSEGARKAELARFAGAGQGTAGIGAEQGSTGAAGAPPVAVMHEIVALGRESGEDQPAAVELMDDTEGGDTDDEEVGGGKGPVGPAS